MHTAFMTTQPGTADAIATTGSGADSEQSSAPQTTSFLRRVLHLDALSCAGTGAVLLVGATPVADLLDVGQVGLLRGVGVFLVAYAAALLAVSTTGPAVMRRWARRSIEADAAWVLGSIALIVLGSFSVIGAVLAAGAALVVGALAAAKYRATS